VYTYTLIVDITSQFQDMHIAGVSNIRPAGHNPARQAFLSGLQGLPEMSKMIDLCLSGVLFQALK